MNPGNQMAPTPNNLQPKADASSKPDTGLIQAEIGQNIPVKQQAHGHNDSANLLHNPISHIKQFLEVENEKKDDKSLEPLLKDMKKDLKEVDKNLPKKAALQPAGNHKPLMVVFVTIAIASALSVSTYFAFKQNKATNPSAISNKSTNEKDGTSSASSGALQAAGGALVSPSDLSDLSLAVQSKVNSFNDNQDYNQTDLSDQNLGL
jgi:uncharacterized protein YaaR (DUF327 family)